LKGYWLKLVVLDGDGRITVKIMVSSENKTG